MQKHPSIKRLILFMLVMALTMGPCLTAMAVEDPETILNATISDMETEDADPTSTEPEEPVEPDPDAASPEPDSTGNPDAAGQPEADDAPLFVYLSDLDWTSATSGWSGRPPLKDRSINGSSTSLRIGGKTYEKGIGTHAQGEIVYHLDGAYRRLTALAGIAEASNKLMDANQAGTKIEVWGDGVLLYEGPNMIRKQNAADAILSPVHVDITGVNELWLVSAQILPNKADGTVINTSNHIDWVDTRLWTGDVLPELSEIQVDGAALPDFDPSDTVVYYEVALDSPDDVYSLPVPKVTATAVPGTDVTIVQAKAVPGEAHITVENEAGAAVYTVRFGVKDTVFASDLPWILGESNYSTTANRQICKKDTNILGSNFKESASYTGPNNLTIGNAARVYDKGIGAYGNSSVVIALDGNYSMFYSDIGLDGLVSDDEEVTVKFTVKGDRGNGMEILSESANISYDDPAWTGGGIPGNAFAVDVTGVEELELVTTLVSGGSNWTALANWGNARLLVSDGENPIPTGSTRLRSIDIDGVTVENFAPGTLSYDITLPADTAAVPEISYVLQDSEAAVEIAYDPDDKTIPNTTTITITKDGMPTTTYTLNFRHGAAAGVSLEADRTRLNPLLDESPFIQLTPRITINGQEVEQTDSRITAVEYTAKTLRNSGGADVVSLVEDRLYPVLNDTADGLEKAYNGGTAEVSVKVTLQSGEVFADKIPMIVVNPFYLDYSKTVVGKMQLQDGDNTIKMNFADALEAVKRLDNLTNGIPKLIYLVGWQGHGHDSDYPSFDQVNESMAIPGMSGRDSLIYIMNEAKKHNTTLSLHCNVSDFKYASPLYALYSAKNLWAREESGAITSYWVGGAANCYEEYESYLLQQRVDRLLDLLPPLVEGRSIHFDAFHLNVPSAQSSTASEYYKNGYAVGEGTSKEEEINAMRKYFWYLREVGLDLTSEASSSYRNLYDSGLQSAWGYSQETFIGMQPHAWSANANQVAQLDIPADLYAGTNTSNQAHYGVVSYKPEGSFTTINENSMLSYHLATSTNFMQINVSALYLSSFERLSASGSGSSATVNYSDGVKAVGNTGATVTITQTTPTGTKTYKSGGDVFIPAVFKPTYVEYREIMVSAASAWDNREWTLPDDWSDVLAVDLWALSTKDPVKTQSDIPVTDGKISLTIPAASTANPSYVLVPAGQDHAAAIRMEVEVTGLELDAQEMDLDVGDIRMLNAKVLPANATDRGVRFESSDPQVATVGASGKITAQRAGTTTITARTTDGGLVETCVVTVSGGEAVAAPVADIPSGVYLDPQRVHLSCDTDDNIDIYYTLDGSQPIVGLSHFYTENDVDDKGIGLSVSPTPAPIEVYDNMTIKAVAVKDGYLVSDVATFTYGIVNKKVATPVPSVASGFHTVMRSQGMPVWLSTWTPETRIHYTVDGSEPDESSPQFMSASAIYLGPSEVTIKAIAYKDGFQPSDVATWTYRLKAATGTSWTNPVGSTHYSGVYPASQFPLTVSFVPLVTGAYGSEIRYTSGSGSSIAGNPSTSSSVWTPSATETVAANTNFKTVMFEQTTGQTTYRTTSNLAISQFKFMADTAERVDTPGASIPSGSRVEKGTKVTFTVPNGATGWYSVNGMAPTGSAVRMLQVGNQIKPGDAKFNNELILDKTTTVRLVATRNGYIDSDVVTYTYYVDEDPPVPTKANLPEIIAEADRLVQSRYTPDSWEMFASALEAARAVDRNADATQEEITSAFGTLAGAMDALEKTDPGEVVEVEKLAIEAPTSVKRKKAVQLTALLTPADATYQEVTWEVLNPTLATISSDGLLTAGASTGFVFVKVTAHNGVSTQIMIEITT